MTASDKPQQLNDSPQRHRGGQDPEPATQAADAATAAAGPPANDSAQAAVEDAAATATPRVSPGRVIQLSVPSELDGERLDRALSRMVPALSRSYLKKLAKDGFCVLNDRTAEPADVVRAGDRVVIHLTEAIEPPCHREDGPLDVRYEDEHVLVVNKPVGMVCHPAKGHHVGTLLNVVVGHLWDEIQRGWSRPHLANRLDMKTSGLVLVGKTPLAHRVLQRQMDRRQVKRTYVALVWGDPGPRGVFDVAVSTVVPTGAPSSRPLTKSAVTEFTRLRLFRLGDGRAAAYVLVRLGTGRTHQIRVHFAEAGHPILGEDLYAKPDAFDGLPPTLSELMATHRGYALHAMCLEFNHPASGETIQVAAGVPRTFAAVLRWLHLRDRSRRDGR